MQLGFDRVAMALTCVDLCCVEKELVEVSIEVNN